MILLAEGDIFRDPLWVRLYPLPSRTAAADAPADSGPRFVWSPDSRHLLLLTRHSGVRTLSLEVVLRGTYDKARLLDLVKNFTLLSETKAGLARIIGQIAACSVAVGRWER